ncbi:GNAT family N-acetyltransferase [Angustibacter sp. McL0619]|uniref:GNAT family N-acetyltransferase n=1 Tax=Angustibacter sp. McL0619 TaxID=3415676 RepID=UPI003CF5E71C
MSGWESLRQVRLAALRDSPTAFYCTWQQERRNTPADWADLAKNVTWFVAAQNSPSHQPMVGLVGCLQRPECPDEPEVIGMWVHPVQRGTGTADELLTAAHHWARTQGASSIALWVVDSNTRARRFYERHLYRTTGEKAPLPGGRPGREHRMRRSFPAPTG